MIGLLCLDLGTSSAKTALFDLEGRRLAGASAPYPTLSTSDGGVEQEPEDWIRAARTVIARSTPPGVDIEALCLTGQMQDLILEGDHGAARPAIIYSDQRAAREAREIREDLAHKSIDWDAHCGNRQDATSCAAMFRRLARTDPDAIDRTRALTFGPAGHLAHRLGAGAWCDPTTASALGLLDAAARAWSPDVVRAAGIDPGLLPTLTSGPGQVVGSTNADARELIGLDAGVPIVLAPGDAGTATIGVTGLDTDRDHVSLGTSGWIAGIHRHEEGPDTTGGSPDGPSQHEASHHLALGDGQLRISAVLSAGAAAAWAREAFLRGMGSFIADQRLEHRAHEHGRGPTGLLFVPALAGERYPVRDDGMRAALMGLDARMDAVDLYAGVLEGVAFALSHALKDTSSRMETGAQKSVDTTAPMTVVGGGAASAPWRRILADVFDRPIHLPRGAGASSEAEAQLEATLIGAAIAGAEAVRLDHRITPLAEREGEVLFPDSSAAAAYAELRPAHRALYDAAARIGTMGR
ncbi:FGGY family carbohydrate kinase [Brachybacterium kimchii]|uniref:FGGY family carbohydrate kinase n=1 Tax=Brachybacterium kimchii TaxID=2942909 RepID=A0ABY4N7U0_9MICO|nr:FGGY family carbohydrate kinase [Brachybacterium kimchii]UQN29245.1 FGGY family carbohydrate kinase [Brachybacterium kimchii]